jgi:hypothetical protein
MTRTRYLLPLLMALALGGASALEAQSLDPASAEALAATLRLLQDPAARDAALGGSPQGAVIDRDIQAMTGGSPALTQEFYALAAQVFSELTLNSGGDLGRMNQALASGRGDPAGFAAFLSPETLARLRDLATRISDRKR